MMNLRALRRDTRGLSTVEYVLILIIIACLGMAAWKMFGTTAAQRATSASGDVGGLEQQSLDGPRGGGRAGRVNSRVEDATADATPPPTTEEQLFEPVAFGGAALLLIVAMVVRRRGKKGGGDGAKK